MASPMEDHREPTVESAVEYKIVVLGAGGVGKSALTIRLVTDHYLDEYDPTIEDSYRKIVTIDDRPVLLDILDTAGQEEFSSMQDLWVRRGQGFLLVYSITSKSTFDDLKLLRDRVLRTKDTDTVPIVLVGNKSDLESERKVTEEMARTLAAKWKCPYFETSAKARINVEICFYEAVREIRRVQSTVKRRTNSKKRMCVIL